MTASERHEYDFADRIAATFDRPYLGADRREMIRTLSIDFAAKSTAAYAEFLERILTIVDPEAVER